MKKINFLVTCKEYAQMVGVTRTWIDQLTRRNTNENKNSIEPTMIGKRRFIDIRKYPVSKFKKQ